MRTDKIKQKKHPVGRIHVERRVMYRAWDKVKRIWIPGAYGFHILGEAMLIGGLFQDYRLPDLNNIVITESIGMKDKSGEDIYDGDIVKWEHHPDNLQYVVTWEPKELTYYGRKIGTKRRDDDSWIDTTCTVIGNIYDGVKSGT